jgi:hypothetical protein
MTIVEFKRSISKTKPPAGLAPVLAALWWAAKDDWDKAHGIVMKQDSREAAWVHAYLHRVEGGFENAGYWYRQARRNAATGDLAAEWAEIAAELLTAKRG